MRAFFHFLVLFTSSRTSALFLFAFAFCFFFPFRSLCSFTFFLRDGKQRADFGSNDSGSVGPLHSMSRPDVYDLLFNAEYIIFSFSIRKSQMI